jgi:hypothetical protein
MCQIIAKPVTTEKNAMTTPHALFFGISIASYFCSFGGCACCVRWRCFTFHKASTSFDLSFRACFGSASCRFRMMRHARSMLRSVVQAWIRARLYLA